MMNLKPISFEPSDRPSSQKDKQRSIAEKLKSRNRIQLIEKTVRSMSSMADDRVLHDLDPVSTFMTQTTRTMMSSHPKVYNV